MRRLRDHANTLGRPIVRPRVPVLPTSEVRSYPILPHPSIRKKSQLSDSGSLERPGLRTGAFQTSWLDKMKHKIRTHAPTGFPRTSGTGYADVGGQFAAISTEVNA